MKVIYNDRNIYLLDYFFIHINRKSISDCILKLLNLYSISIEDSNYKLELLNKLVNCIEKYCYEKEYESLAKEYNLPLNLPSEEFDYNKFYFYEEKKNVNFNQRLIFSHKKNKLNKFRR